MNAALLLDILHHRRARIWVEGNRLELDAPPGTLTPDLLTQLREHKPALLALLTQQTNEGKADPGLPPIMEPPKQDSPSQPDPSTLEEGEALMGALESACRVLNAAHNTGGELAIGACWARYQDANTAYTDWSRQLRHTHPDLARKMDREVAARIRALDKEP